MRVIRHESGWDIALDMVFTDKATADIVARRIQHAVHALIRDAVDASMCGNRAAVDVQGKIPSPGGDSATRPQVVLKSADFPIATSAISIVEERGKSHL